MDFTLSNPEEINMEILSIQGVKVRALVSTKGVVGSNNSLIQLSGLPAGVYLLKIDAGKEVHYQKFVVD